uniref:Carboxylic ester hydrolase n=1 Tax=Lutzomyia longipalpis TaxID=7200 RepID=A0A1B0CBC5_LUTLO
MKGADLNNVIVYSSCGPIKGVWETSSLDYKYAAFYDIPYAKPPLGPLRFKDPEPLETWPNILDATESPPYTYESQVLDEDCLKLNVYSKNVENPCSPQPVMVFITGGFFIRSPSHKGIVGPDYLLQKDVILITFKYRCGALGFLSSDDPEIGIPGNAGLKDQVILLRWVQENIAAFGGDPHNVTIFGFSAGGCSIHYHMISPLSKGLFQKAIIMSASAFYVRGFMPKLGWAVRLARYLGWRGEDNEEALAFDFLRGVNIADIKDKEEEILTAQDRQNGLPSVYGPTLEAYRSRMTMIIEPPEEMMKNAWSYGIPLMIGGTLNEGLLFYGDAKNNPDVWENINQTPSTIVPYNLTQDPDKRKVFGDKMKLFYFGNDDATVADINTYIDLMGDTSYWYSVYRALMGRLKYQEVTIKAPTWLYHFSFNSPEWYKYRVAIPASGYPGVAHADDTLFLLSNYSGFGVPKRGTREYDMMQLMVRIYTSFATNGDPNNELLAKSIGKWTSVSASQPLICCNIDSTPEMLELPE